MLEVGSFYLFTSDNVTPCFTPEKGESNREYVDEPFYMVYKGKEYSFMQHILTPAVDCRCECISISPIKFNVEKLYSRILLDEVKYKQREVIKEMLKDIVGTVSELDAEAIAKVAIPYQYHDLPIMHTLAFETLKSYLESAAGKEEYGGSYMGATSAEEEFISVLTVLFGHRVAYAASKLRETGFLSIKWEDNKFKIYYKDEELQDFISKIGNAVGVKTSEKDSMLQEIKDLVNRNNSLEPLSSIADDVSVFRNWYDKLYDDRKEVLLMTNQEIAMAAAHNDTTTLARYGVFGLRQTMWLIAKALPVGCDTDIFNFYETMYRYINSEGWNRLSIDCPVLYECVCNMSSIMREEDGLSELKAEVEKISTSYLAKYLDRDANYCK